jgi:adenylate cyclase class 2
MLEVEVKYRGADRAAVLAGLSALGAHLEYEHEEADLYFNAPDRDLKQSDEAFRMRRIGDRNLLTYKGPRRDSATKIRPEFEVPLADGAAVAADMERLLVSLGYRPVATVRKRRTAYRVPHPEFQLAVCLDEVEKVGSFVEVEIVAEESRFSEAQAAVLDVAAKLGLTDQERRSYLGLLLESPTR